MASAQNDFIMQRGTYGTRGAIIFQCLESDGTTPMDLTGATVTLETTNLKPANIVKTNIDGSLSIDGESNVIWLPTEAETLTIPIGRWTRYRAEIAFPNGTDGLRVLEGYLIGKGV